MKKSILLLSFFLCAFVINAYAQAPRPFPSGLPTCLEDDFRELEKLYDATDGDNWWIKTNWFTSSDMATWLGIVLTSDGCSVKEINLGSYGLTGSLPNLNFPNLYKLELFGNTLSGSIPDFSNIPNLKILDLSNNRFTGSVPNFTFPANTIYLNYNELSGNIPNFNSSELVDLRLENNKFVFGDMLEKTWFGTPGFIYYPQANADLTYTGSVLIMNTGIPSSSRQRLEWYRQGEGVATTNTNEYATTRTGGYKVYATHKDFPGWVLESNTYVIKQPYPVGLPSCLQDDFDQLYEFYDRTNGSSWTNKTNWITGNNMANWYGIVLTSDGCSVKEINLSNNNLSGEFITLYLNNLNKIDLSKNNLSGGLPDFVLSLNNIDVSDNKYIFNDLENRNWINLANSKYAPQKKIPIYIEEGGSIYVNSPSGNSQYEWYKNNVLVANTTNSSYNATLTGVGNYSVKQKHNTLSIAGNPDKNLILESESVYFDGVSYPAGLPTALKDDFDELKKLYFATGGANWTNKTNWFTSSNMNSWRGVFTNGSDIIYLTLPNNNLVGTLPNLNFPKVTELYLNNNSLTGNINSLNIPIIEKLHLNNNQLSGTIPNFSTNLSEVYLQYNELTGSIPNFNQSGLQFINLSYNQLTGNVPNFNLPFTFKAYFNNNSLSGPIPNFTNFNPNLLDLSNNQLTGSIPNINFTRLYNLNLNNNNLSGNIPNFNVRICPSPSLCTENNFDIGNNQFLFGDIYNKDWATNDFTSYAPQSKIPLNLSNGTISVSTGRPDNEQTFKWYKDGQLIATNSNSQYTPTTAGTYHCLVAHNTLTFPGTGFRSSAAGNRNLILESEAVSITVLPIELLSFQAQNTEGGNLLTWQTASEVNTSHFDIEASPDPSEGGEWRKLGEVKTQNKAANYTFLDATPLWGVGAGLLSSK